MPLCQSSPLRSIRTHPGAARRHVDGGRHRLQAGQNGRIDESRRARMAAALKGERQLFDQSDVAKDGTVRHWQAEYLPNWSGGEVDGVLRADRRHHATQDRRGAVGAARSAPRDHQPHGGNRRMGTGPRRAGSRLVRHGLPHPRSARGRNAGTRCALWSSIRPQSREIVAGNVAAAFEQGKPFDIVVPFMTAAGRQRWVRPSANRRW